jgi:hypothetical protein
MASVNRFTEAQPAQDNYFNTFVPLPMQELTALGMSRKQDLEKNQAALDKAYNDAIDIKYIKQSPFEEANYRSIAKGVSDLALEYKNTDLTLSHEMDTFRRKLRTVADPTLVKRMEESALNFEHAKALKMDLRSKNHWNDMLDEDPAATHNSATGVYNYMPEGYFGKASLFDPILSKLKPNEYIDYKRGMLVSEIKPEDIDRVAVANAKSLVSTSQGKQELRLFKKEYPDVAKQYGSDEALMRRLINDHGAAQMGGVNLTPLPSYMFDDASGPNSGKNKTSGYNPLPEMPMPSENINPNVKRSAQLYRSDKDRSSALDAQIKELDKQKASSDPQIAIRLSAMRNELLNEKNKIDNVIESAKQQYMPEYDKKKSQIESDFLNAMTKKGIDPILAKQALDDAKDNWGLKAVNDIPAGSLSLPGDPTGLFTKPFMRDLVKLEKSKKYGQELFSEAQGTFEHIDKLDRQFDSKIGDIYKENSEKAQQDNGIVLSGSGITDSQTAQMTTRDGKLKTAASSKLLKQLKDSGGQNMTMQDVSYVDKKKNLLTEVKDINSFILNADNIGLDMVAPASKVDGTYSFVITAKKTQGDNKPDITKKFKVKLDEFSLEGRSWMEALGTDLADMGKFAEADRLQNSDIETEVRAKQNDKEMIITPNPDAPDDKIKFVNNGDGTYTEVNSYTNKPTGEWSEVDLNTITQLLYSYRNKHYYER